MNEAWSNAPSLGHESMVLKNLNLVHFFLLKMNEAWLNAPSLRYEFMVLKNLNLINFSLPLF